MGDSNGSASGRSAASETSTCQHTENCCVVPAKTGLKIGRKWATALAGFISGAVVASIILIPWMYIQGKFCDKPTSNPILSGATYFPGGESATDAGQPTP